HDQHDKFAPAQAVLDVPLPIDAGGQTLQIEPDLVAFLFEIAFQFFGEDRVFIVAVADEDSLRQRFFLVLEFVRAIAAEMYLTFSERHGGRSLQEHGAFGTPRRAFPTRTQLARIVSAPVNSWLHSGIGEFRVYARSETIERAWRNGNMSRSIAILIALALSA